MDLGFDLHELAARQHGNFTSDQARRIPEHHVTVLDCLPLTTPTRTLFDVAALGIHPHRLGRAIDNLWARRLTDGPRLHTMLGELAGRGRPGITLMREALAERGPEYVPPESNLERRFHRLVAEGGQEPLERQVTFRGEGWIARVDSLDRAARLVAEVDSDRYHTAVSDQQADARRTERLRDLELEVIRFGEDEIFHHGREAMVRLWDARQEGRRRHGAPRLLRRLAG